MKIYLFYRPYGPIELQIETFLRQLGRYADKVTQVNVDTRDGDDLSRLHDIMSYPTVLVTANDGSQLKLWPGELPSITEIEYYLHSV